MTAKKLQPEAQDYACRSSDLSGTFLTDETVAFFNNEKLNVPKLAASRPTEHVLGLADPSDRWVEIDLSDQTLKAWNGSDIYLQTAISTGLPWTPTPTGEFRIWIKLRATKMEGGSGRYYYYLPNVPYTMFFSNAQVPSYKGYGLHGTYWHSDFGTPRSHGCVNLPTPIAEKLYYWTTPTLPDGKSVVRSSEDNLGTRIVIHE